MWVKYILDIITKMVYKIAQSIQKPKINNDLTSSFEVAFKFCMKIKFWCIKIHNHAKSERETIKKQNRLTSLMRLRSTFWKVSVGEVTIASTKKKVFGPMIYLIL